MQTPEYAMVIEPQKTKRGQHYSAYFPDLPGCATMARSLPELRKHAKEAVALYLWGLEQTGQPIPPPSAQVDFVRAPQPPTRQPPRKRLKRSV